ncbi:MAG: DUF4388 domain-containing protein [bacterium]|nr:DUF4388 domain-containing protein [bacterium]
MAHFADGYTLEDILLITALQKKTGELTLETERGQGTLRFLNGNIVDSDSPHTTAIGDLLIREGMVSAEDVEESLEEQKLNPGAGKIGKIFIESGRADQRAISQMVKEQIFTAIQDFSTWKNVYFTFQEKDVLPSDDIHVTLTDIIERMAVG